MFLWRKPKEIVVFGLDNSVSGLPRRVKINNVSDMIRAIRPILCILIAVAFAISSVGWSAANAQLADWSLVGTHHSAPGEVHFKSSNPGQAAATVESPDCGSIHNDCEKRMGHQSPDGTPVSCCTMACHVATQEKLPESQYSGGIEKIWHSVSSDSLAASVHDSLEKPPRPVELANG